MDSVSCVMTEVLPMAWNIVDINSNSNENYNYSSINDRNDYDSITVNIISYNHYIMLAYKLKK